MQAPVEQGYGSSVSEPEPSTEAMRIAREARDRVRFEEEALALAEEVGAVGIRVEKPDEIAPALARALAADRPVVIDVATDIDALAPTAVS